jgi:hypothetical protein
MLESRSHTRQRDCGRSTPTFAIDFFGGGSQLFADNQDQRSAPRRLCHGRTADSAAHAVERRESWNEIPRYELTPAEFAFRAE